MTLPTATHPAATNTAAALVRPAMDRHAISTAMIADMLANASNIRTAVSNGTEYIPRALKCETAGVIDFVIMRAGVEVAVTGYPLTAGFNPDGGMHRITRFTGTNLWGII